MDSRSGVQVEGLREVVRTLEKAGVELSDLKGAFQRIGQNVAEDAKENVNNMTGRLAASIRPSRTKNKAVIRAGSARLPYAGVIEYGWPGHNIEAQEYLRGAVEDNEAESVQQLEDEIARMIERLGLK